MSLATVTHDIAPLYKRPDVTSTRIDEALYGMSVQLIDESESGWCYVRTEFATEGYTPANFLERREDVAGAWRKYKKMVVLAPYIDVQQEPEHYGTLLATLPRGGILVPLSSPNDTGWSKVGLADGSVGYTRLSYIGEMIDDWTSLHEEDMRWNIVETALAYNGVAFRSGGRTPLGIDAVGLVTMSYLINGVYVPREMFYRPNTQLRTIQLNQADEGDILYFQNSMAVYIGDNRFIHATEQPGYEGVVVNSFNPRDKEYQQHIAESLITCVTLY